MAKTPTKTPVRRSASRPLFNHPEKKLSAPDPHPEHEPAPNFDLLTDEMKAKLREDALVQVEARERDRAMEAYLAAEVERIERELVPDSHEEMKEIYIDLAIYADRIIIDGKHYMHGRTYTVKKSLYDSMKDIQAQTWQHYANTHKDPNEAMQKMAQTIAKGGSSFATISASTGQVTRF
jgi:hypothetical protein